MFAARLKQLRKENGLTLREFAARFGLNYTTICKYENGQREPDLQTLSRLADFFGVALDYLVGRSPVRGPEENVYVYHPTGTAPLPPEAMHQLEEYIAGLRKKYAAPEKPLK